MEGARYSGKLSKNTVFQSDNDDIMAKIWQMTKENEKMKYEIEKCTMEVDGWLQVLECSSAGELDQLVDDFASTPSILPKTFKILHPSPERDLLTAYSEIVTTLCGHDMIDPAQGHTTLEGNLFLKFPMRPPKRENWDMLVLLKPGDNDTYSLLSHNLPPTIPVDELEKQYLKKPNSEDGLKNFITVVSQYTKALHSRLHQIMMLESIQDPIVSSVMYNKGVTNFCFTIDIRTDDGNEVKTEFVFKFDPLNLYPNSVRAKPIRLGKDDPIPPTFQASLDDLTAKMTDKLFTEVLLQALIIRPLQSSSQESSSPSSSTHEAADDSGPLFDTQE